MDCFFGYYSLNKRGYAAFFSCDAPWKCMPLPGYVACEAASASVCLPDKFILVPLVALFNLFMNF